MSHTRREFIRYVVAGSVASGCPVDTALLPAPDSTPSASKSGSVPEVEGEHFEICHQVRDGHHFDLPAATAKTESVIVGGGVAGLSAAYFLRGKDWLLLEKEDHFGGNAYQEEFDGQPFATGSAYAYHGDEGDVLASELGLKLPMVNMPDPTLVNKTYVPDTWKTGITQLPYPKEIVASFVKFREDVLKMNVKERMAELDALPFRNSQPATLPKSSNGGTFSAPPTGPPQRPTPLPTLASTTPKIFSLAATASAPFCPAASAASRTSSSKSSSRNTRSACSAKLRSSPLSSKKTR